MSVPCTRDKRHVGEAHVECTHSGEEDLTEEVRELSPAVGVVTAEQFRGFGVAENAGLVLREDSVARQSAQDAVEGVGIRAVLLRKLGDRARTTGESVGHAEVRGDAECLRPQRAAR